MTLIRRDVLAMAVGMAALIGVPAALAPALAAGKAYATGDMALGADDAPVTVIEYASMTCPHCATFHNETFPGLKAAYIDTGKIRLVYREFPLDRLAFYAAVLARCAGPERFFGFVEVLFRQQDSWARAGDPMAALARLGRVGGVGEAQFGACINDQELGDSILKTRLEGNSEFDVNSTPTFIINGKKHAGMLSLEQFSGLLEPLLPAD